MNPLEEWYYEIPLISRIHSTLIFATTLACQLDLVSPFHLYFNWHLILRGQYWRILSSFFYCGSFSVDFLFHMFFLVRYSRMLEEGSFRGRTPDFLWMLMLGATSMTLLVASLDKYVSIPFLSSPLTSMMVYIWSRRNPTVRMNFLGLFTFNAPYLPWVLLGFTVLLNNTFPSGDLVGMGIGHVYFFLEDVYPRMQGGFRLLEIPGWIAWLLSSRRPSDDIAAIPEVVEGLPSPQVTTDDQAEVRAPREEAMKEVSSDVGLSRDEIPNVKTSKEGASEEGVVTEEASNVETLKEMPSNLDTPSVKLTDQEASPPSNEPVIVLDNVDDNNLRRRTNGADSSVDHLY